MNFLYLYLFCLIFYFNIAMFLMLYYVTQVYDRDKHTWGKPFWVLRSSFEICFTFYETNKSVIMLFCNINVYCLCVKLAMNVRWCNIAGHSMFLYVSCQQIVIIFFIEKNKDWSIQIRWTTIMILEKFRTYYICCYKEHKKIWFIE